MMTSFDSVSTLSEQELLDHFEDLVVRDRRTTAALLVAIAEIDERKIWAKHGCSSMFTFCLERFHMSEQVTAKRLWAARTARRFPAILPMVESGELHLSAIHLLAGHLTAENSERALERAKHKSSREVERLVAELAPRADVPSRIRAMPGFRRAGVQDGGLSARSSEMASVSSGAASPSSKVAAVSSDSGPVSRGAASIARDAGSIARDAGSIAGDAGSIAGDAGSIAGDAGAIARDAGSIAGDAASADHPQAAGIADQDFSANQQLSAGHEVIGTASDRRSAVPRPIVPLSPRRYKIEITVDEATHDKLRSLQDLLGRSGTGRDPAAIISRAIDVLLDRTLARRAGCTDRPKPTHGERADSISLPGHAAAAEQSHRKQRTRTIPAAVRREVWRRDCGRCCYVDAFGRRCGATRSVEFHHRTPFAAGGAHTSENIELRCAAHNQYQADLDFGRSFMDGRRGKAAPTFPGECRATAAAP